MIVKLKNGVKLEDTTCERYDPVIYRISDLPAKVYGVDENLKRMPADVAASVSEAVGKMGLETTGGRISFRTNSDYIIIHAKMTPAESVSWYSGRVTYTGFEIKEKRDNMWVSLSYIYPSQGPDKDYVEGRGMFCDSSMREIMIYLPTFARVDEMYIGFRNGSKVLEPKTKYKYELPVVFYGSSIVHGAGCGSNSSHYPAVVSRMLNTDYIQLGFGGAALAEDNMIDYICGLKMNAFVYDYDHNAPNPEYLKKTHYNGYLKFRKAHPYIPVIMATRVDYYLGDRKTYDAMRDVVLDSYKRAKAEGDELVWFVDGKDMITKKMVSYCMSDNIHPNDVGYYFMAKKFSEVLKEALKKTGAKQ